MYFFRLATATFVLLIVSASAHAMSLTWTFHDAYFHDRTSLSGSFDFDADTETFSNIDLTTHDGLRIDGSHYTRVVPALSTPHSIAAMSLGHYVGVILTAPMTNSGGNIGVMPILSTEGVVRTMRLFGHTSTIPLPKRFLVKGHIAADTVSLAEPTTLAVFALGLIGIVSLRRRSQL